ncbi:methyltransferase domain-containing protein [Rummeliibacillus sp. G93]|uniref:class I SAM-dependent DNA methyltransferase n=1 Tax=Rummeliibacillus sp. G93 TaxID=2939494 RepID=UPI00201CA82A|nr:class I SAM-dependent methyltransferase [Rummeliibacillus sp. G93]UQW98597.1 methyltransferase domain-containing protein [Rummeliibacillus sp. G93]
MSSYSQFAQVYDGLMTDVPYDEYVNWVTSHASPASYPNLLDIGCGTGTMAAKFAALGYKVSGIDLSEDMLMVASQNFAEAGLDIPLYCMSMDELEGFNDLDVITIPIDSINYVLEEDAVRETLKRIYESLKSGGQLFFDVHSIYKMDELFMDSPFTYDDGEVSYLWMTEKGEEPHSVHHDLVFYSQLDNGYYERFEEFHTQRTFDIEMYKNMLKEAGFQDIFITADFAEKEPVEFSERIFFRAVK